jgi:hypothetical protein
MAKMGRPQIQINWTEVDKLLTIQATDDEIAGWFDISQDTLARACRREHQMSFADYSSQKRGKGKISLRRQLWQRAHDPKNTACLIFACKTLLGLREYDDRPKTLEVKTDGKAEVVLKWTDEDNA